jgi:predicted DNA-binding transcriptional regulator AlpA
MQGISAAKKVENIVDVKRLLQKKLIAEVKYLNKNKMLSVSQIVKITGRSRNTIYKVLKENYLCVKSTSESQPKLFRRCLRSR